MRPLHLNKTFQFQSICSVLIVVVGILSKNKAHPLIAVSSEMRIYQSLNQYCHSNIIHFKHQ